MANYENSMNNSSPIDSKYLKNKTIITTIVTIIVLILIIYIIVLFVKDYDKYYDNSPFLIHGTKLAKISKIIPGKTIPRSKDGKYGIEFTYGLWLYIEDSNFSGARSKEWKHVFHVGNASGMPLQAPGVWIYPGENKLAINMNTYHSVKESCDIGNLPINKWFHITLMVIGNSIDIYLNCQLKKRCRFIGVPKLNYGDVYINIWQGFDGFISQFRYWNYSLEPYQVEEICKLGPSSAPCTDTGVNPPYLSKDYWMTTGFPDAVGFPKKT